MKHRFSQILLFLFFISQHSYAQNTTSALTEKYRQYMLQKMNQLDTANNEGMIINIQSNIRHNDIDFKAKYAESLFTTIDTLSSSVIEYRNTGKLMEALGDTDKALFCYQKGANLHDNYCINKVLIYLLQGKRFKNIESYSSKVLELFNLMTGNGIYIPLLSNFALTLKEIGIHDKKHELIYAARVLASSILPFFKDSDMKSMIILNFKTDEFIYSSHILSSERGLYWFMPENLDKIESELKSL